MNNFSLDLHDKSYVAIPNNAAYNFGIGDFSIEGWINTTDSGTILSIKGTEGGRDNGGFLLVIKPDGSVKFATDDGSGFYEVNSSPTAVMDGLWHHIAAVRDSGKLNIYFDGELVSATVRNNAQTPLNVNNTRRLLIGYVDQEQELYRHFSGLISEVRIWDIALDKEKIESNLYRELSQNEAGLVGYWPFEFGLCVDYSLTTTDVKLMGDVSFSTKAVPMKEEIKYPMTLLFSGTYATAIKYGGRAGAWNAGANIYISQRGVVIHGNRIIQGANFNGNTVSWCMETGNATNAEIKFKLKSSLSYYWIKENNKNLFEGWIQSKGSGKLGYKGELYLQLSPCFHIQSLNSGLIWSIDNEKKGTPLLCKQLESGTGQHFTFSKSGNIIHMNTGMAVTVKNNVAHDGQPLILQSLQEDNQEQLWEQNQKGQIQSFIDKTFVITLAGLTDPSLVLGKEKVGDNLQKWHLLSEPQFIYNEFDNLVIDIQNSMKSPGANVIAKSKKNSSSQNQLWCFSNNYIISDLNGMVLTMTEMREPEGTEVVMQPIGGDPAAQQWIITEDLIYNSSGRFALALRDEQSGTKLILAIPEESKGSQRWHTIQESPSSNIARRTTESFRRAFDAMPLITTDMIEYEITIETSNQWFAGTDDKVEISLGGVYGECTELIELKNSETHKNPFERGNKDIFKCHLKDVGQISSIFIRYGANNWFWNDRWIVSWISVYDPIRHIKYYYNVIQGAYDEHLTMPSSITIPVKQIAALEWDSVLSIDKFPATFFGLNWKGWIDHAYARLENEEKGTIYFDAAGGHEGSPLEQNVLSMHVSLNKAIRMCTGYDLGPEHELKSTYGSMDKSGKETCGIQAGGFRNWDGQCHQILNRLCYISGRDITLDAASPKVLGIGISYVLWGPYGVGFKSWCKRNCFVPPHADSSSAIFDYISKYFGNKKEQENIYYHCTAMQSTWTDNEDGSPQGEVVGNFIRALQNDGFSNSSIADLVCWPESTVKKEEKTS